MEAQEKTSTCAVPALLRTRINLGAPQPRISDPTTLTVGLQAPNALLAPSGYSIGSSKESLVVEHRRGLCRRERPHKFDSSKSRGHVQEDSSRLSAAVQVHVAVEKFDPHFGEPQRFRDLIDARAADW
jgi:hypothetical protein